MRWITLVVLLSGCLLSMPKDDGSSCTDSSQCKSNDCYMGRCSGSDCSNSGDCEDGWECVYYSGDPIFGLGSGSSCIQHCTADDECGPLWGCSIGGSCTYVGPQLLMTYEPEMPQSNETVHFAATYEPEQRDAEFTWRFTIRARGGDGEGETIEKTGASVDMSFPSGQIDLQLKAETKANGTDWNDVYINACSRVDEPCYEYATMDCCAGLVCQSGACVAP